jgi:hypothetical protein
VVCGWCHDDGVRAGSLVKICTLHVVGLVSRGWSCWQKTPHHVYDLLLGAKKEEIEPTFAAFAVVIISEMNAGSKNY